MFNLEVHTFRFMVVWQSPVTIESYANDALLSWLELLTVNFDSVCVSENQRVANYPWLSG